MRAAAIVVGCGLIAMIARADAPRASAPRLFDHAAHGKAVELPCVRCHATDKGNLVAPRHATCFGSCHTGQAALTKLTAAIADDQLALCNSCHAETALAPPIDKKRLAVSAPPADGEIRVGATFSHARHASRGAARQCATCHTSASMSGLIGSTPRPTQATCTVTGCHDGAAAFGAIEKCTRCHREAPTGRFDVTRPEQPFSHATHESRATIPCASCHALTKTGELRVAGHTACATGTCHPTEFSSRVPVTCNACHTGSEPWRPMVADRLPSDTTEFGATLDHGKHSKDCATCHTLTTSRTELRPPRGHRACATAGCHAATGGPSPQLTACEACHQRDLAAQRTAARLAKTWSVRSTFVHAPHTVKAQTPCVTCHTDLSSPTVLTLATPPKATCATEKCHDGTAAFKVTGTSCLRCHPGAKP